MHSSSELSHPADRPTAPDAPMLLDGCFVPGDATLMARCMLEEMLQVGIPSHRLDAMTRDPEYQALYALRTTLGDDVMDQLMEQTLGRVGNHRHHTVEHAGHEPAEPLTSRKRDE